MKKFTFKKEPRETGLRSVGYTKQSVNIKLNKKKVGFIYAPNWNSKGWKIAFMISGGAGNPNYDWHWKNLKVCETEEEARQYVQDNIEKIVSMGLREEDDD